MVSVLYISYTGALQPLGESQVVAYLERLARDHRIHLLTFERPADLSDVDRMAAMSSRLDSAGIGWTPLRYHRGIGPASTAWDVARGRRAAVRIARSIDADVVHCRSYVPGMMGLHVKRRTGARFLFDMRGFWVDERVDGGMWRKDGPLYRIGKQYERAFYRGADAIVSLTEAGARIVREDVARLGGTAPCTVIPTCADLERFALRSGRREGPLTIGYLGSAGTWYRFDDTARAIAHLFRLRPDARLVIANRSEHELIRTSLERHGVPADRYEILSLTPTEVPRFLDGVDATVFFIKQTYSKTASAPTKLAEFLASGIPCLVNHGVGDMGEIVEAERVGAAVHSFDDVTLLDGVQRLLNDLEDEGLPVRCRDTSERLFSVERGVRGYDLIYQNLACASSVTRAS